MKIYTASPFSRTDGYIAGLFTEKRLLVEWLLLFIDGGCGGGWRDVRIEIWEPNSSEPSQSYSLFDAEDLASYKRMGMGDRSSCDELSADGVVRFFADDRF